MEFISSLQGWGSRRFSCACAEVVFKYPTFKSLQEGLDYINTILDPNYTGRYGIVDTQK